MITHLESSGSIDVSHSRLSCSSSTHSVDLQIENQSFIVKEGFCPKTTFFDNVAELIEMKKKSFREKWQNFQSQKWNILSSRVEKQLFWKIRDQINLLERQLPYLLSEGILALFLGLLDIQQKCRGHILNYRLQQVLDEIIRESSSLLREYFIYKEYSTRKQKQRFKEQQLKLLQQSSNTMVKQHIRQQKPINIQDQALFNQIEKQMSSLTINQIITQHMQQQIAGFTQKEEVCRICSAKVKLEKIQFHLRICKKICNLKEQLEQKLNEQQNLLQQAKALLKDINRFGSSQQDQSLKKVVGMMLMEEKAKKEKRIRNRSNSNGCWNSDRQIALGWQFYLQEHEELYGQNQTLTEIIKVQRNKTIIEKNIQSLQEAIIAQTFKHQTSQLALKLQELLSKQSKSFHLPESRSIENELAFSRKLLQLQRAESKDQVLSESDSSLQNLNNYQQNPKLSSWESFDQKLKSIRSKRVINKQDMPFHQYCRNYLSLQYIPSTIQDKKLSLENFEILKALGQGAYGKVYMARRKETKDIYALKIIKLSEDNYDKDYQTIKNEHDIYKKIAGDHLVKAPFSFSERGSHIFVLQFMPGGDLRKILETQVYFEEEAARFYLAQIVVAIEYLHKHEIIHRDLKPENIVIDQYGHLKLTDFGLSAIAIKKRLRNSLLLSKESSEIKRTTKRRAILRMENIHQANIIGTPDYIAPEIINHISSNNKSIDWWSLGVIAYELMIGVRPFSGDTIDEVIQNIRDFNIQWPEVGQEDNMISTNAKDLIEKLLNKDIMSRLGANGAADIKAHPFFQGVNWEDIKYQKPPCAPKMKQLKDYASCEQDPSLRLELESRLGNRPKQLKGLKPQKFVRYDLLGSQTLQNFTKIYNQQTTKLKKLGTCRGFELEKKSI